jgi:hypothetical protein
MGINSTVLDLLHTDTDMAKLMGAVLQLSVVNTLKKILFKKH